MNLATQELFIQHDGGIVPDRIINRNGDGDKTMAKTSSGSRHNNDLWACRIGGKEVREGREGTDIVSTARLVDQMLELDHLFFEKLKLMLTGLCHKRNPSK